MANETDDEKNNLELFHEQVEREKKFDQLWDNTKKKLENITEYCKERNSNLFDYVTVLDLFDFLHNEKNNDNIHTTTKNVKIK